MGVHCVRSFLIWLNMYWKIVQYLLILIENCLLFTDASKPTGSGILTQEGITNSIGQEVTTLHPISYISVMFIGSKENQATFTEKAYAIHMAFKKQS